MSAGYAGTADGVAELAEEALRYIAIVTVFEGDVVWQDDCSKFWGVHCYERHPDPAALNAEPWCDWCAAFIALIGIWTKVTEAC